MGFRKVADIDYELIRTQVFWVSLLGVWLIYALFAFWICTRKWHWFLRFACLAGGAALLMGIEAPALTITLLSYGLTIWAAKTASESNTIGKLLRLKRPADQGAESTSLQIGLADALLGVFALAILLKVANTELASSFTLSYCVAFGVALGAATIFGSWMARAKGVSILVAGIVASIVGGFVAHWIVFSPKKFTNLFEAIQGTGFVWGDLSEFLTAVLICNAIAAYLLSLLWYWNTKEKPPLKPVARSLCFLSAIAMVLLSIGTVDVYRQLLRTYEIAWHVPSSEDEINGFDELATAGNRFEESLMLSDPSTAPVGPTLAKELESYSEEFRLVESGLQRSVQTIALESIEEYDSIVEEVQCTRAIARALVCRSKQRLYLKEPDKALRDCCRIVEISVPMSDGKMIVFELFANAIEDIGCFLALDCLSEASPAGLRDSIKRMIAVESGRADPNEVFQHDCEVFWEYQDWFGRLCIICDQKRHRRHFDTGTKMALDHSEAFRRQIITLMAIELHRREHGRYPTSLSELVPRYLPSVPQDPCSSDQPLSFRLSESKDSFQLYSIGPDGKDDGGKLGCGGYTIDEGDFNILAQAMYENATTDAERRSLTVPWQ